MAHGREGRQPASRPPKPLAPGERPPALLLACALCAALTVAVAVGSATVHDLARHGGSRVGGAAIALLLAALAVGLYRRRYWAAVAFQALLVFQLLVAAISLVLARGTLAVAFSAAFFCLGGLLFYRFVRVLGRVQATALAARPSGREERAPLR